MKTMAVRVVDWLFVVVHGTASPTAGEWADYLDLVERHGIERTAQLVYTEGGGPTPAQRRELNDLLAGHEVPVAVVTGSAGARCGHGPFLAQPSHPGVPTLGPARRHDLP
jgi:hypothetical protein